MHTGIIGTVDCGVCICVIVVTVEGKFPEVLK